MPLLFVVKDSSFLFLQYEQLYIWVNDLKLDCTSFLKKNSFASLNSPKKLTLWKNLMEMLTQTRPITQFRFLLSTKLLKNSINALCQMETTRRCRIYQPWPYFSWLYINQIGWYFYKLLCSIIICGHIWKININIRR